MNVRFALAVAVLILLTTVTLAGHLISAPESNAAALGTARGRAAETAIASENPSPGDSSTPSSVSPLGDETVSSFAPDQSPEDSESSDDSIYGFAATWTDQENRAVRLAEFAGRPVVLSMIFTHCSYACPMIVRDMKQAGSRLSESEQDRVGYVLVSLDPERDSPDAMRRFAGAHGLDLERWTLLSGGENQVRILAALLGVRYRPQSDGQFAHTSLIVILNQQGEIVHQQKGLDSSGDGAASTAAALGALTTSAR